MDFYSTANEFLSSVWTFIVALFDLLVNNGVQTIKVFDYIITYIFEIPGLLLTVFNSLPVFMQDGINVVFNCIILVFALKIIKIIRDVTI